MTTPTPDLPRLADRFWRWLSLVFIKCALKCMTDKDLDDFTATMTRGLNYAAMGQASTMTTSLISACRAANISEITDIVGKDVDQ